MKCNLGVTLAVAAALAGGAEASYEAKFKNWLKTHGISINPMDWVHRFEVFILNDQFIASHNEDPSASFTMGHNEYSHLTFAEFKKLRTGLRVPESYIQSRAKYGLRNIAVNMTDVPNEVDWVSKGGVTPVKNQGMCGSCWAFSATGAIEGAAYVSSKKLVSVSEQELVDCDHNGDMGCNGGLMDHAFKWVKNHGGLCREEDYTYHAKEGTCAMKKCKAVTKVAGFHDVPANDEQALKAAVAKQPVSVAIEADQPEFQFYKSGVFDKSCGTKLDHGVLVVGYGEENGKKYWKVKNSWGADWGDQGYIKLAREFGPETGQCGVAMVPSYPTASVIADDEVVANDEEEIESARVITAAPDANSWLLEKSSGVTIVQCGDVSSQLATFSDLSVSPKVPKRGKPIHFVGNGNVKTAFDSAHMTISVKLGGQLLYSHFGNMCGRTHIPLPLGIGHIDVDGFACPVKVGSFKDIKLSLNLPVIAPEGNYEINLTSEEAESKASVFCVQVKMDLSDSSSDVYQYTALA
ncbi:cysteine protease family C01A [Achlya hypogyna]|uniref:Cysteine protease family C01A n=1 Tax=Achlya hypogyna TaxID=1202772 RepID=A0A1V9YQD8_ACHHY|nr:cysteine protease family C01A [Achlya hypogyna]